MGLFLKHGPFKSMISFWRIIDLNGFSEKTV